MKFNGFFTTHPAKFLAVMAIFLIALISIISLFSAKALSAGDCCSYDWECGYNPADCDQAGEGCCEMCVPPAKGCTDGSGTCQTVGCASPLTCSAGFCRYTNGHTCTSGSDCISGFCVDGYCCSSNCTTCQRCDVSGSTGTCTGINADSGRNCTSGCTRCVSTDKGKCIARSDTNECGTCQNCPAGACLGAPAVCSSFSGDGRCQDQEGCSWMFNVQTCSCITFDGDMSGCLGKGECTWRSDTQKCTGRYDCSYYSCLGTPTACSAYTEPISCENQTGCQFPAGTCGGTPTACGSLLTYAACRVQGGCSWNWISGFCDCSNFRRQTDCEPNNGCTWNEYTFECEGQYDCGYNICQGTPNACSAYYINQSVCLRQAGCQWFWNECQLLTANNGKNCNDQCTRCAGGSCVNRNQCNTTECSAGLYCDSNGGSCADPDTSSQPGENVCEACVFSAQHSFGEGWPFESPTTQYCCGDDSSEYSRTRVCSSGCTSNPSDTMCCNNQNDCVYTSACYAHGSNYCSPWNPDAIGACSSNRWSLVENCAAKASEDSDNGNLPLVAGSCKDYTTCQSSTVTCAFTMYADVCTSGTALTEYYDASGAACDHALYGCVGIEQPAVDTDGGDVPAANGQCTPGMAAGCINGAFVRSAGTGGGTDHCEGTCGTGTNSCNYIEYYPSDSSDNCADLDSCASKPYDPDTNHNTCNTCLTSGDRWNIGGIAGCCGDDANEYLMTKVCNTFACTSNPSDNACCNQDTDCVNSDTCYNSGDTLPGLLGATCVSGTWRDTTAPTTTINPDGVTYNNNNESAFTLTCTDSGDARGPKCEKTYYKIINDGESCGTTGFTDGASGMVTCPFGQICNKRVCFYSADRALNQESIKFSNVFHLETNVCMDATGCGDACLFSPGICNATNGNCYTNGGCRLKCSAPTTGPGQERVWNRANCGRSNATKCDDQHVCANSITDSYCSTGGASTLVTGNWNSYTPASGYYGVGYIFHINILNASSNPSKFSILTECEVVKANGNMIFFDSWGNGDNDFSYTITASDPEGEWNVSYCGLWSDFLQNGGWQQKGNNTLYHFYIDKTVPSIAINVPVNSGIYGSNITVNATVTDGASGVGVVSFRWENATSSGAWVQMANTGGYYTAALDVGPLADGRYSITVWANDTVGNYNQVQATNILIDRQPPSIVMLNPSPGWFRTGFNVRATVTDNQGVASVRYRWENSTTNGTWTQMSVESGNIYAAPFTIASVASNTNANNYTFRVWSNDTFGNSGNVAVSNVGVDYVNPSSQMTSPASGAFVMSKAFNITWSGSDAHSGVKCYNIVYMYCNNNNGQCSSENYTIPFAGGACTGLVQYEFDTAKELWWVQDPNNYTFFFRSVATDIAGNVESEPAWDRNITVYIPKLVSFSLVENTTKLGVRNGGKVPNQRDVVISVSALPSVTENIDISVFYANHTLGILPSQWTEARCQNTRQCNVTININVSKAESIREVDYYIRAQNSTMTEDLPPSAPNSYFYYSVYYHAICNFLVNDEYRTILGSTDLIALEIRNIHDQADNITLELAPNCKFVENDTPTLSMVLNPAEERIIYARLVPMMKGFTLFLNGTTQNDIALFDEDIIDVRVDMPPNFSELGDAAAMAIVLLAGLVYFAFLAKK